MKAIALNTSGLDDNEAELAMAATSVQTGLPCADAVRGGAELLLEALLS